MKEKIPVSHCIKVLVSFREVLRVFVKSCFIKCFEFRIFPIEKSQFISVSSVPPYSTIWLCVRNNVVRYKQKNMLDFVIAVDDPVTWHTMNLLQNRKHYSILKLLGPTTVSSIQHDYGASIYYNTLVPMDGRVNLFLFHVFSDMNSVYELFYSR